MNTKVNKAYFLIPVVYLSVIIFLLYMQFSGSSSFSSEVSGISISGEKQSGAPGKVDVINELSIRASGLHFSFGEDKPAVLYTQDGLIHSTVPEDYRVTASGIDIRLSKGLFVSFYRTQNNEDSLHISISAEDPESIKYIHLPVIGEESSIAATEGVPVLSVKSETLGNFFLTLPEKSTFNEEESSVIIFPESESSAELVLERTAGSGIDAFTYWVSGGTGVISAEALDAKIEDYISESTDSLLSERYNATRGTWTIGTGISEFDENALVMAATENIGKASFENVRSQLNQAAASHYRDLSILSSSLFGNIVNEGWAFEKLMETKTRELTTAARNGDLSIFSDPDLIAAVLTEDSDTLTKEIISIIKSSSQQLPSLDETLTMISFYTEIYDIYPDIAASFSEVKKLIEPVILPAIKVLGNRLYLSESSEQVDIYQTLSAGTLLMNRINSGTNEDFTAIGRELINSVLMLADESGFIPKIIMVSADNKTSTDGIITPETIYPLLTNNPYYPSSDYFYNETGEKISVLNQAETFTIETTDFGYRMKFDFPAGQTHIFAIRNLQPFYQMHLLGYKWNSDHRFLTYSSGWWFDKQHNTLFVKIKHRMKTEEILIYTQAPQDPVAPVSTEETSE